MSEVSQPVRHGTRWGRTIPLMAAAFLGVGSVLGAVAGDVVALNFVASAGTAEFSSSGVRGQNAGLAMVPVPVSDGAATGSTTRYVLRAQFGTASVNGMCVSKVTEILGVKYLMRLEAGDDDPSTYEISMRDTTLDIVTMNATGEAGGTNDAGQPANGMILDGAVELGIAAHDIQTTSTDGVKDPNPLEANGTSGLWGIQALRGRIYSPRGTVQSLEVTGNIKLPGLEFKVDRLETSVTPYWYGCNDPDGTGPRTATPLPN